MTKITAIIPTLNEASCISKSLQSVSFADEVIVIDSFSTDDTVDIATSLGAKVIQRKFDNFSAQKNFAIQQASYDWIFFLDADELIDKELQKEIIEKINTPEDFVAFYIYRNFYFKNKRLNHSGWRHDKVIRLFNRQFCRYEGFVHEEIITEKPIGFLKNKIDHYSFSSVNQYKKKLDLYASLQAKELIGNKKKATWFHRLLKPSIRFFIQFVIKRGFLDGYEGYQISKLHAYGVRQRYKKLVEFQKRNSRPNIKQKNESLRIGFDAKRLYHNTTGLGNYSRDLVSILGEFYEKNEYFLFNPKPRKVHRFKEKKNMMEIFPSSTLGKTFSSLWRFFFLKFLIKKHNIDIYHGLSGEIPLGLPSSQITVVTIHDLIFMRYPKLYSFFDRKIHFLKFRYAAKYADRIIAISEQTKKDIVHFLNISPSKIEVIYQGCHHTFKKEYDEAFLEQIKNQYLLPESFVLNVGTIEERKNLLTLVKAIKRTKMKLVVVGKKTSYYQEVKKYIDQNNLNDQIIFFEGLTLKELAAFYQLAKVFVYPSLFEGFGIPIIEALYSKTPVITSKGGCFSEAGGPYSLYVDPLSPRDIQEKLIFLYNEDEKRREIVRKSYNFVQKFNDNYIGNNLMKLYEKVIYS